MPHRLPVLFVRSFGNRLQRSDIHSGRLCRGHVVFVTKQVGDELKLRGRKKKKKKRRSKKCDMHNLKIQVHQFIRNKQIEFLLH